MYMRLPKHNFMSCTLRVSSNRNLQLLGAGMQLFRIPCNLTCNRWPYRPHSYAIQYATTTETSLQPALQLLTL